MSRELKILTRSMLCISRDDREMKGHHRSKGHLLTTALKGIRRTRAEGLLQWHAKNGHDIHFTDEKIESSTTTRTRFMLKRPLRCVPRVQRGHHPSYVTV
jgi:hypothetical protein